MIRSLHRSSPRRLVLLLLTITALGWGLVATLEAWWYRSEVDRAERDTVAARYDVARDRLARLASRWPRRPKVEYLLGGCEASLGNSDAALDAWGRVPEDSAEFPYATIERAKVALEHGRLAIRVGRGLAVGDIDNDGRQDLLILSQGGPLAFFRNLGTGEIANSGGHALTIQLEGRKSNRDGVGAEVRVTSIGRTQVAQRFGGGSFLSASDGRLHFGLGTAAETPLASVEIRWPSGQIDVHKSLRSDTGYRVVEGDPVARNLEGGFRATGSPSTTVDRQPGVE